MLEYKLDIKNHFSQERINGDVYIIVALDILGYSNYVMSNYNSRGKRETLRFVLRYIDNLTNGPYKAAFFSDSLFIFLKVTFEETMYRNFSTLLNNLEKIVTEGMSEGFLIRGGVCVGECTIEDNVFFGPGVIKAHILEEQKAECARIIMDDFDYEQLVSLFKYTSPRAFSQMDFEMDFIKDGDYYAFDYIEAMFSFTGMNIDMPECLWRYKGWIRCCGEQIQESSSEENIEKHLSKLSYHINSYNRIAGQYNLDYLPDDIRKLD